MISSADIANAVVFFSLSMITIVVYTNTKDLNSLWILALMIFFHSSDSDGKPNQSKGEK